MGEQPHSHVKAYTAVFLALLAFTALTVAISRVHLGSAGNILAGLAIAVVKASLVFLIFMHLKFDRSRPLYLLVLVPMALVLLLLFANVPDGVFFAR
jgi:cytochrome c oxidase subunit 4